MKLLLPGNHKDILRYCDLHPKYYGWLLTPRRTMTKTGLFGLGYGVDNECYTLGDNFRPEIYKAALRRIKEIHGLTGCHYATAPDVVYDPLATLRLFETWQPFISGLGFPVALVAQDGLENLDIPWPAFEALFIGGSTEWKLSQAAADLIIETRRQGKWSHVGRVNSVERAHRLRIEPDSVDGTAWARHPGYYTRLWHLWIRNGKARQGYLIQ